MENLSAFLLEAIKKVSESCKQVRNLQLILVFACIIIFASFWNANQVASLNIKIDTYRYLLMWYDDFETNKIPPFSCEEDKVKFEKCKVIHQKKYFTKEQLNKNLNSLIDARTNNFNYIKVPYLDLHFDVNDLGMVGGFGLIIIYFILYYGMINKKNQLSSTLAIINSLKEKETKKIALELILMNQILTIPENRFQFSNFIRKIPKTFYSLPAIVMVAIYINDLLNINLGQIYLDYFIYYLINLSLSLIFLILLTIETLFCLFIIDKIDKLWFEINDERRKLYTE